MVSIEEQIKPCQVVPVLKIAINVKKSKMYKERQKNQNNKLLSSSG